MNILVIKCGGSILEQLPPSFYKDLVILKEKGEWIPVIVHGGGPLITNFLSALGIQTSFLNGLRITTEEVLDVVEMVLSGVVNKQIVRHVIAAGGNAAGISGVDGGLLMAKPASGIEDLGFVGEVDTVNLAMISQLISQDLIPVISPIGIDRNGQRYNINGDTAASAIANALGAKLLFISDIPGIMQERDGVKIKLDRASSSEVLEMIEDGTIWGGMIPKVKAALDGLSHDVSEAVILNGLEPYALISYCEGKPAGTRIILEKEMLHG